MEKPQERLDKAMEDRRVSLNLEWRDVATAAGVTYETLRALRRHGRANPLTKRGAEDALKWAPGSIDTVLAGGEPTPMQLEHLPPELDKDQLRDALRRFRQAADDLERLINREP